MLTLLPSVALAQFYSLTYRNHATDCTALTDGKNVDLCFEEDSQNLYMCVPDEGDCSGSEWKLVDDEDTSSDDQTLSYNTTTDVITIEGGNTIDISEVDTTIADTTCDSRSCAVANTGTLDGYEASALLDNTDAQDLSLSTNTLSLSGDATTVDLSGYLDNTDTQLTEEQVEDFVGGMLGGTETRISVTYDDANNAFDFVVDDMLDNTDSQDLSYNTTTNVLSISGGDSVTLEEGGGITASDDVDWTGYHTFSDTARFYGRIYSDVTGDLTGNADTVTTITTLAPDTATTQATQPNITTAANLTTVGTIGTGVWQGTAINATYLDGQSGSNTGDNTVATSGDSATSFFSSGEIADAQISNTLTVDGYMQDTDIDTFSELQSWVSDETLLKAGTLADAKYCTYNLAGTDIVCNSEGGGVETNSLATTITGILDTEIFIGDGADSGDYFPFTGDITLSNAGVTAIDINKINETMLSVDVSAVDGDYLQYDETGTNFTWRDATQVASDIGAITASDDVDWTGDHTFATTVLVDDIDTNSGVLTIHSTMLVDSNDTFGSAVSFEGTTTADGCDTWGEGSIFYNTTDDVFCFCNTTTSIRMATTASCF